MDDTGPDPLTGPGIEIDDPLEDATRNCPRCLEPMQAYSAAWWCDECGVGVGVPNGNEAGNARTAF